MELEILPMESGKLKILPLDHWTGISDKAGFFPREGRHYRYVPYVPDRDV